MAVSHDEGSQAGGWVCGCPTVCSAEGLVEGLDLMMRGIGELGSESLTRCDF